MSKRHKTIEVDGQEVRVSHPEKIMYPDDSITKGDVIDYYFRIAEYFLSHATGRPVSMQRFPEGIQTNGFYQKEGSEYFPDFITRVDIPLRENGQINTQCSIDNTASLVYLANQGMLTAHTWLCRSNALEYPDRIIIDLDPPDNTRFADLVRIARRLHKICDAQKLNAFPMLTGSRGIHVTIPILPDHTYEELRPFITSLAKLLQDHFPDLLTMELRKEKRKGKIFIDTLRNAYGQTGVTPYSLRPLPGAPVATPLSWHELQSKTDPQKYTLRNIFRRLSRTGDPWRDILASATAIVPFSPMSHE
jgi:bifunctional non-homologous end joining protein LigD